MSRARIVKLIGGASPVLLNDTDAVSIQMAVDGPGALQVQRGDGLAPATAPEAGSVPFPVPPGFGSPPAPLDDVMIGTGARLWGSAAVDCVVRVSWTEPSS